MDIPNIRNEYSEQLTQIETGESSEIAVAVDQKHRVCEGVSYSRNTAVVVLIDKLTTVR